MHHSGLYSGSAKHGIMLLNIGPNCKWKWKGIKCGTAKSIFFGAVLYLLSRFFRQTEISYSRICLRGRNVKAPQFAVAMSKICEFNFSFHSSLNHFRHFICSIVLSGVCCIKSYVSKRKKHGYKFRGLVRFAGKLHHENPGKRTNPQIRTHVSYVYET